MKSLSLVLSLSLGAFLATFSLASADCGSCSSPTCSSAPCSSAAPVDLTIAKATGKTATVTVGSKTTTVPISFGDGASWDSVKDSYSVAPSTASALEAGTMAISVQADGGVSFRAIKSEPKAASKPAQKK